MPSRLVAQINGELAQSKSKGKAFAAAIWKMMNPGAIAKETPKTQRVKKTK